MAKNEQSEFVKAVVSAVEKKIMPELQEIKEKQKEHGEKLDKLESGQAQLSEQNEHIIEQVVKNSEDIEMVKIDVKEMKEDVADANFTSQRIESKLHTVIKDQDDMSMKNRQLNRRVELIVSGAIIGGQIASSSGRR